MMAVDSGSEVHTAPVTFPWNVEQVDKTSICLSDVQGDKLKVYGTALLNYGVHDVGGNVIEIGTRFLVSDTVKFVLSVGELGHHSWNTNMGTMPCLSHEAGCQVPLTRKGNTFYLSARLGFHGEAPWKMVAMTSAESATPSPSQVPSEHCFLRSPKLSLCQWMQCRKTSLLDPCCLLGLLWLLCGTVSKPSMV